MRTLHWLALAAGAILGCAAAQAQTYPAKAIRIVVPIAPGGSTDMVGRLMGQRLSGGSMPKA